MKKTNFKSYIFLVLTSSICILAFSDSIQNLKEQLSSPRRLDFRSANERDDDDSESKSHFDHAVKDIPQDYSGTLFIILQTPFENFLPARKVYSKFFALRFSGLSPPV